MSALAGLRMPALSATQEGMLFHQLSSEGHGIDIEQVSIRLKHTLDERCFTEAWQDLLQRHPVLRSAFQWEGVAVPAQIVFESAKLPVTILDWQSAEHEDSEGRIDRFLGTDRLVPFDLSSPPLMRLTIIRLPNDVTHCLWTFHHILLDGRSFSIVLADLFRLYEGRRNGVAVELCEPPKFADFLDWLSQYDSQLDEQFWRQSLAGLQGITPLSFGDPEPANNGGFSNQETVVSANITTELANFAKREKVTLHTLLQCAWALLLHHYTREEDIVFGSTRSCRHGSVVTSENMVGLLINTVPFRVQIDGTNSLQQMLQNVRATHLAIHPHQFTPLKIIRRVTDIQSESLFDSLLVFDHLPLQDQLNRLGGQWRERQVHYQGQTNSPLALIAYGGTKIRIRLEYEVSRFGDKLIAQMLQNLKTLLHNFPRLSSVPAVTIPYLSEDERQTLLSGHSSKHPITTTSVCLHSQFEAQATRNGNALALTFESQHCSYRELNNRANQVATQLIRSGVRPNELIGLCFPRSVELIVSLIAILKTGAAYVPLDPDYPPERLNYIIADAKLRLVVGDSKAEKLFQESDITVLLPNAETHSESTSNPELFLPTETMAYVIYTSGSTGQPKGVKVNHHNVSRLFSSTRHWFQFSEKDTWSLFHSISFDFSVWEIWGALLHGGRLVIVPYWVSRSADDFRSLIAAEGVTVLNQTPSAFKQLMEADKVASRLSALRFVIFGGEALSLQDLRPWFEWYQNDGPSLVNMYGITETTVHVTYKLIRRQDLQTPAASLIGEPIPDLQLFLLDEQMNLVPPGVVGQMYVGGAGLAEGYLHRESLTKERFLPSPFTKNARLYKTGDLAKRRFDGELEYIGRTDLQVKVRGFRIEVGEIEVALQRHPDIDQAVVTAPTSHNGETRLAAYLRCVSKKEPLAENVREFLAITLPDHMIPALFVNIDEIPLTNNGKVDRKALPDPMTSLVPLREYTSPQNEQQAMLVAIWSRILGVDQIGIRDNFFDLGGDSIFAIKIVAAVREAGHRVSPRQIFSAKTVENLARLLEPIGLSAAPVQNPIIGPVAMMPAQHWFFERNFAEPSYWNQCFLFDVKQPMKTNLLERAIQALSEHHDVLRARFHQTDYEWEQSFDQSLTDFVVTRIDLTRENETHALDNVREQSLQAQNSLDITNGPLIRVIYFSMPSGPDKLLWCAHHLLVDGVSWAILLADLESIYTALLNNQSIALPPKTQSVSDWVDKLTEYVVSERCQSHLAYWDSQVSVPQSERIRESAVAGLESECFQSHDSLSEGITQALLTRANRAYNTRINDLLLAALLLAMNRWTGQTRLVIDLEGHGREDLFDGIDVSRTVGWFTSIFPIYLELDPQSPLDKQIVAAKEQLRLIPNNGLDFLAARTLISDLPKATQDAPDILFNYLGQFDQTVSGLEYFKFAEQEAGPWHGPRNRRTHPLEVLAKVSNNRLRIDLITDSRVVSNSGHLTLINLLKESITQVVQHCESSDELNYTPSDFPLSSLNQEALNQVTKNYALQDILPLTPMQHLFYTAHLLNPVSGLEQWRFRIQGPLDVDKYQRAWHDVINRHAIFRSSIMVVNNSGPIQIVCDHVSVNWICRDITQQPKSKQEEFVQRLLSEDRSEDFDLGNAPLIRLKLIRTDTETHELIWSTHHLCVDGWSWPVVFADISSYYQEKQSRLPDTPAFGDYVRWLNQQDKSTATEYWRTELRQFTDPTIFAPNPTAANAHAITYQHSLSEATSLHLSTLGIRCNVTLNTVFQALWAAILSQVTKTTDIVFGVSSSGRPAEIPLIETVVGPFVNNIPKRINCSIDQDNERETLSQWLGSIQDQCLKALPYEFVSPVSIQQCSAVPLSSRLFESILVFQNYHSAASAMQLDAQVVICPVELPEQTNYPITLVVRPGKRIELRGYFQPGYLDHNQAKHLFIDFDTAISAFVNCNNQLRTALSFQASWTPQLKSLSSRQVSTDFGKSAGKNTAQILNRIWANAFDLAVVNPDISFFDLGGQSIQMASMHAEIEQQIGQSFPIAHFFKYPTINSLAAFFDGNEPDPAPTNTIKEKALLRKKYLQNQRTRLGK